MRVDVIISGHDTPSEANVMGMKVKTLLENIEAHSAGTNIQTDEEGKPIPVQVVNLLVTAEQAEVLSLACNETGIHLALRNPPPDAQPAQPPVTAMAGLFGGPASRQATREAFWSVPAHAALRAAKAAAAPAVWVVKVINGAKDTNATFPVGSN